MATTNWHLSPSRSLYRRVPRNGELLQGTGSDLEAAPGWEGTAVAASELCASSLEVSPSKQRS